MEDDIPDYLKEFKEDLLRATTVPKDLQKIEDEIKTIRTSKSNEFAVSRLIVEDIPISLRKNLILPNLITLKSL